MSNAISATPPFLRLYHVCIHIFFYPYRVGYSITTKSTTKVIYMYTTHKKAIELLSCYVCFSGLGFDGNNNNNVVNGLDGHDIYFYSCPRYHTSPPSSG